MAGNILNPGADATVVQAATRASLASHGVADYSKSFQAQADSYSKTMQANAVMWGKLISTAGEMVTPMVAKAGERMRSEQSVRSSAQSESLVKTLDELKLEEEQTRSREIDVPQPGKEGEAGWSVTTDVSDDPVVAEGPAGKIKNNPWSKENKGKRRRIRKERDDLFAAVKEAENQVLVNDEIISAAGFDAQAMGPYKMEMIDAYQGSMTTGEKTDRGNYFVTTYDRKTKKLIHTLHHDPEAIMDGVEPLLQLKKGQEFSTAGIKGAVSKYEPSFAGQTDEEIKKQNTEIKADEEDLEIQIEDKRWVYSKTNVRDIQEGLNKYGIRSDDGKILETDSGIWGPKSEQAVATYIKRKKQIDNDADFGVDKKATTLPPTVKGPIMRNGKPITYTDRQLKQYMIPDDPQLEANLTKLFDAFSDAGYKSGIEWGSYQSNRAKKGVKALIENEGLDRAMTKTWSFLDKSFRDELTSESGLSASLWSALQDSFKLDDTTLKKSGLLAGIDDMSDGEAGIQESDFLGENAAQNMLTLQQGLLSPGSDNYATREVRENMFMEWAAGENGKIKEAYDYGKRLNKNWINNKEAKAAAAEKARLLALNDNSVVKALGKTTFANMFEGGNNSYISETELETINNIGISMANRSKITGSDGAYTWDDTKKSYFLADGSVVPNKATMLSWLFKDQTINPTFKESDFFKSIPEWDGRKWAKENNGGGGGGGDKSKVTTKKIATIKDEEVVSLNLPGQAFSYQTTPIKKINGVWHKEVFGDFVKVGDKDLVRINKSYK